VLHKSAGVRVAPTQINRSKTTISSIDTVTLREMGAHATTAIDSLCWIRGVFRYPSSGKLSGIFIASSWSLRATESAPVRRPEAVSGPVPAVKRMLKRALGRNEPDLYDLEEWAVRNTPSAA
jgi:hypothetical protein